MLYTLLNNASIAKEQTQEPGSYTPTRFAASQPQRQKFVLLIPGTSFSQELIARQTSNKDGNLISTRTALRRKKLEAVVILSFQARTSRARTPISQGLLKITPSALSTSMPPSL